MNYAILFFIILIAFVFLHGSGSGSLMALLIIMFIGFIIYKKPEKSDKWKSKMDFFTNPETSPLSPYTDLIDDQAFIEKTRKILENTNLSNADINQILTGLLQKRLEGKYNLFISNPSAAMTLASYYNVFKKMEELDKKKKKPEKVYYCPLCFRVYQQDQAIKNGKKCPHCHVNLVGVSSPFAFNFANTLATPFSELFSKLLDKKT